MSELHIETRGRGPDLVLLHGWGLNLRVWDGLARELSKSFRLIMVDLPGHGRSAWNPKARTPAEQAWQVHAALSTRSDRYSLLGWSLGGQIAIDLAAAMPGSVDRLVLVATTPRFAASEDWPYGMPEAGLDKLATQLRTNYKRTVSEFLELQVRGSASSERVLAELHSSLFSHGEAQPKALVAGLSTLKSNDLRSMLGMVQAPTLVIAGQYDRVTLPAASRTMAGMLPDARYVEFRRAAHAPFLSHTAEFAELVTKFLRGEAVEDAASVGTLARASATTAVPDGATGAGAPESSPAPDVHLLTPSAATVPAADAHVSASSASAPDTAASTSAGTAPSAAADPTPSPAAAIRDELAADRILTAEVRSEATPSDIGAAIAPVESNARAAASAAGTPRRARKSSS